MKYTIKDFRDDDEHLISFAQALYPEEKSEQKQGTP